MIKKIPFLMIILILFTEKQVMTATASVKFEQEEKYITIYKPQPVCLYRALELAIFEVESTCRPHIINKESQAYGGFQVRQCKLDDYNKAMNTNLTLNDMLDYDKARLVFLWHASMYHDVEIIAKRWNGSGPATEIYWQKVKEKLLKYQSRENEKVLSHHS